MNRLFPIAIFILICQHVSIAQATDYKIYATATKQEIALEDLVNAVEDAHVLFFGEEHDDSLGHVLQDRIYHMMLERYGTVTLSMEMFETDVQIVLDEYLAGFITEDILKKDARAWKNYETDYRPLVERAKAEKQIVIAANAPRRYVNLVSRRGLAALNDLPKASRQFLPKLPIYTGDKPYYDRFQNVMGEAGHGASDRFFYAQCTWDASMAYSIFAYWKKHKKERIFHLNGRFHTDYRQGTITQLRRLSKKIKIQNISCFPVADFEQPDWEKYAERGDFVIISKAEKEEVAP